MSFAPVIGVTRPTEPHYAPDHLRLDANNPSLYSQFIYGRETAVSSNSAPAQALTEAQAPAPVHTPAPVQAQTQAPATAPVMAPAQVQQDSVQQQQMQQEPTQQQSVQPAPVSLQSVQPVQPVQQLQQIHQEQPTEQVSALSEVTQAKENVAVLPELELPLSSATRLKKMLEETNELIVCPGVYDGLSARVALQTGFSALYMTGAGTTASRLGQADLGVAQLHDMREHAEMIANLDPNGPPLIADMDTGYGGPIMVANSVSQYIRAGVAGFHIEDQIQNKRCGHLAGKKVVSREEYYQRIRAAKQAKDRLRSDIVLIARTDANQQHGYDECVARLKVARELGADVGLLEGFKSKEEAQRAVHELAPWPLLLNSVENGASPLITVDEARNMGFRIMIFSFACLAPAYTAIRNVLQRLKTEGVVGTAKDLTPRTLFEVCGLSQSMLIDNHAGAENFAQGV